MLQLLQLEGRPHRHGSGLATLGTAAPRQLLGAQLLLVPGPQRMPGQQRVLAPGLELALELLALVLVRALVPQLPRVQVQVRVHLQTTLSTTSSGPAETWRLALALEWQPALQRAPGLPPQPAPAPAMLRPSRRRLILPLPQNQR